jgi:hypothetical protein
MCSIHSDADVSPDAHVYCAAHINPNAYVDLGTDINSTASRTVQLNS